jgi:iron-sulfur cluster assembly protein
MNKVLMGESEMETKEADNTAVVTMTDGALKEVQRLLDLQGITDGGLRLGVKGGGCSGLSYTVNFDERIGEFDTVTDVEGVKVIVEDAKSAIYLQGMTLDYQKDMVSGAFKFINPNATKTCGCGESFSA